MALTHHFEIICNGDLITGELSFDKKDPQIEIFCDEIDTDFVRWDNLGHLTEALSNFCKNIPVVCGTLDSLEITKL